MFPTPFQTPSVWSGRPQPWLSRIGWSHLVAAFAGALLFYLIGVIVPRVSLLWGYSGLKTLLYEDLGVPSEALASFLAIVGSFIYAVLWLPLLVRMFWVLVGRFDLRKTTWAFVWFVVVYGHAPLLRAMYGLEVCFNQRTGEPVKWYVVQPGGDIVLYDSPGFDASLGVQKRPVTEQICRIRKAQKRGTRPHEITDDPRYVKFFDPVTGQPRIWYVKAPDGRIDLFDAEGTHPTLGEPLAPITKDIIQEALTRADAKQAEAERLARIERERAEAEVREKARRDLTELFGTASYPDDVVIVGVAPAQAGDASGQAAKQLLSTQFSSLRAKGLTVDEFRPKVYAAGHFDALMDGNSAILSEVGLAQKMRAALLTNVDASCHPATKLSGVVSCTLSIQLRVVRPTGRIVSRQWTQVGAGSSVAQAVSRAVELWVERHPDWLEGA